MKEKGTLAVFILLAALLMALASASFQKGTEPYYVQKDYAPGGNIIGWINVSFNNEPSNSLLRGFDSSIKLIDFLGNNGLTAGTDFQCSSLACDSDYEETGSVKDIIQFQLEPFGTKIIGLRVEGNVSSVSKIEFSVESDVGESCRNPLKIDVLNDNAIDWQAYKTSGNYSCTLGNYMGCFNQGNANEEVMIGKNSYCEKITFPISSSFEVGAKVIPGTASGETFTMSVFDESFSEAGSCQAALENDTLKCNIDIENRYDADYFVCIKADRETNYKMKIEKVNPCGFVVIYGRERPSTFSVDYPLYAKAEGYTQVGSFIFNDGEMQKIWPDAPAMEEGIYNYIYDKHEGNCQDGCIIPVRFESGASQKVSVYGASVRYIKPDTGEVESTGLYEVAEKPARISSDFLQLDLEESNITVPSSFFGERNLTITLAGVKLLEEPLGILRVPILEDVWPNRFPAGMPVKFSVRASGGTISGYNWDFGDGSAQTTTRNSTKHIYNSTGIYTLVLTAGNEIGNSTKSFQLEAVSPVNFINDTISKKQARINAIKNQTVGLPEWLKVVFEKYVPVTEFESQLKSIVNVAELSTTDEDYVRVMLSLTDLNVPVGIRVSSSGSAGFSLDKDKIDLAKLQELGAGFYDENATDTEAYKEGMREWLATNLNISVEQKTYAAYYDDEFRDLFSYFKVSMTPKETDVINECYLVVNEVPSSVDFKEDYSPKELGEEAVGLTFTDISDLKEVEFVVAGKIGFLEFPFYIAPPFSQIKLENNLTCDYDKQCDKGENWKNCRADCRPWGWVVFFIFLLLFLAFVIYIILEEWYKRKYENYLFKNRNDLFNLVNFINNAMNKGLGRFEIERRLKQMGWNSEQIVYAFKKVKGRKTGMPVEFSFKLEKKK